MSDAKATRAVRSCGTDISYAQGVRAGNGCSLPATWRAEFENGTGVVRIGKPGLRWRSRAIAVKATS